MITADLSGFLAEVVARNLDRVLAANGPAKVEPEKRLSEEAKVLVESLLESVRQMAWKYAEGSPDLFEELFSIGMVGVCEEAARLPGQVREPVKYLYRAAQNDMLDELKRQHRFSVLSLDAPLSSSQDDRILCLADLLPVPSPSAPASTISMRSQALAAAMRRLTSSRQRAALRRRYGLPGYGPHSLKEAGRALHTTSNAVHRLEQRGRQNLRCDARLCAALGVEVAR